MIHYANFTCTILHGAVIHELTHSSRLIFQYQKPIMFYPFEAQDPTV